MSGPAAMSSDDQEFSLLAQNAAEVGLPWQGPPVIRRVDVRGPDDGRISAIVWGASAPELVLLHGGGQNAHTWDTVALALDRPLVAIDLPGHGESSWRDDARYHPDLMAPAVATAIAELAPAARAVVGMSLGGLTAIALAAERPDLVRRLVLVDVTPGVSGDRAGAILSFIHGPDSFASREEIVERAVEFNPQRSRSSLERGVIHNTRVRDDGRWVWKHHLGNLSAPPEERLDYRRLWDGVDRVAVPILLVRGRRSPIVTDEDVAELLRRQPSARVVTVDDAGHSVQGDQPRALAQLIADFIEEPAP